MHTTSCNYFQENFKETRKLRISQTIWIKFQKTSAQDLWSFTQRRNELQFYIVPQCSLTPVASILIPLMMLKSEGSMIAGCPSSDAENQFSSTLKPTASLRRYKIQFLQCLVPIWNGRERGNWPREYNYSKFSSQKNSLDSQFSWKFMFTTTHTRLNMNL